MVRYIDDKGNPFNGSCQKELQNILTKQIMTEEIRSDLLHCMEIGQDKYEQFRTDRFVEKKVRLSDTIHRTNIKTMKSLHEKPKQGPTKKTLQQKGGMSERKIAIATARGLTNNDLLLYDIVPSRMLFDDERLTTKPDKHILVKELETHLEPNDYKYEPRTDAVDGSGIAYFVDVMANMRKIKPKNISTFGILCKNFTTMIDRLTPQKDRIDFIMDSHMAGSIKDSERQHRTKLRPIEVASIERDTPLPVDMNTSWSSNKNKSALEKRLYEHIVSMQTSVPTTVISQIYGSDDHPCVKVYGRQQTEQSHLNSEIDEADMRIIAHIMASLKEGSSNVVVLSNATDVIVALLYYMDAFRRHGLKQLRVRAGVSDTLYTTAHSIRTNWTSDVHNIACNTLSHGMRQYQ